MKLSPEEMREVMVQVMAEIEPLDHLPDGVANWHAILLTAAAGCIQWIDICDMQHKLLLKSTENLESADKSLLKNAENMKEMKDKHAKELEEAYEMVDKMEKCFNDMCELNEKYKIMVQKLKDDIETRDESIKLYEQAMSASKRKIELLLESINSYSQMAKAALGKGF